MIRLKTLKFWSDTVFRSPEEQMALDEAIFDLSVETGESILRCYHWDRPAITLGYFSSWESDDLEGISVRRWTGGGRVEHGEDLTFALVIPATEPFSRQRGPARYSQIHEGLKNALSTIAVDSRLESATASAELTEKELTRCFASPVAADLVDTEGSKIAGGAQRRVAGAILHQGSVRLSLPHRRPEAPWIQQFCEELSESTDGLGDEMKDRAHARIEAKLKSRYDQVSWNQLR